MGKLKYIELENFKSYVGKQVIGPFDNFTAIIGPNGSGKSNMMDAISFVLGVQSKHLRSSNLKELVFRKDSNAPPARRASVTLLYEVHPGEIPGYQDNDIQFSRHISTTGVSTYRINGQEQTFEEYEAVLQKIGVLVKARNFLVFQGDVESVASKNPIELTKLFEYISGSDQLKDDYERLKQEKENIEENAIFALQKKKMMATEKKEAQNEKNEAEYYQQQRELIDELKAEFVLWQIFRIKGTMEDQNQTRTELAEDLAKLEEDAKELDDHIQTSKQSIGKLNKAVAGVDKDISGKEKKLNKAKQENSDLKEKIRHLEKKIDEMTKQDKKLEKDYEAQQEKIRELSTDVEELRNREEKLRQDLDRTGTSSGIHLSNVDLEEYNRLRLEASSQTNKQQSEKMLLENEISNKALRRAELEYNETSLSSESESIEKQIAKETERLRKVEAALHENEAEGSLLRKQREHTQKLMTECENELTELQRKNEEVTMKLQEAGDAKTRSAHERTMIGAIESMKAIYQDGVKGRLIDLIDPIQKKYSVPVTVACGRHMDAIVVSTKAIATECIQYLKDQRIGTASFLPLDNIEYAEPPERLRSFGQEFKLCIDLIKYSSDEIRPAILYAVGATVVCDTLQNAQDLCFRRGEKVKVVTLNGHVISKAGTMTGGTTTRDRYDRWEAKEIESLKKTKSDLDEKINAIERKKPNRQNLIDLEMALKSVQARTEIERAEDTVIRNKISQLELQRENNNKRIKEIRKEIRALEKEESSKKNELNALVEQIQNVEYTVFRSFSSKMGVDNIRQFEDSRLKQHKELLSTVTAISEQRAQLESQLEYESKRGAKDNLNKHREKLQQAISALDEKKHELSEQLAKDNEFKKEIETLNDKRNQLVKERKEEEAAGKVLQTQSNELSTEKDRIQKKLTSAELLIENLRSQLHEVLQKATVDEVILSTREVEEASSELSWKGSRKQRGKKKQSHDSEESESVGESTQQERQEEGQMAQIDLSSVEAKAAKNKIDHLSTKEMEISLTEQIDELTADLLKIQPNMHATERYEGVVEKLKSCNDELEAVQRQAKDITTRFEEVREKRHKLFIDCFNKVSETVGITYKELTRSSKHTLGGTAYLTLDNSDEPYLSGVRFSAMPPTKRFRDLNELSGGEKTVAALALLFSIHSFRQAPFFVLDEVDAALDNVNVQKVCNYIRQQSKHFQCIVISLKDMFFGQADMLVGVCKDIDSLSSRVLTLSLKDLPEAPSAISSQTAALESAMMKDSEVPGANAEEEAEAVSPTKEGRTPTHENGKKATSRESNGTPGSSKRKPKATKQTRGKRKQKQHEESEDEDDAEDSP